jgi:hypothetical protein
VSHGEAQTQLPDFSRAGGAHLRGLRLEAPELPRSVEPGELVVERHGFIPRR